MDFDEQDYVFQTFKKGVQENGFSITEIDEEGYIYISFGELDLKISLDNLRKEYQQTKEDDCIHYFVQTVLAADEDVPDWNDAMDKIYPSFFPSDYDFKDAINFPVTEDFNFIITYVTDTSKLWILESQLEEWNVNSEEVVRKAYQNIDRLLESTTLEIDLIEDKKLGYFSLDDETMKSALLISKKLKEKVSGEFGWPVNAVIPVRDFCYLFSANDFDFFSERLGSVVMDEYQNSGYQITAEILECSDEGIKAIGKYKISDEV